MIATGIVHQTAYSQTSDLSDQSMTPQEHLQRCGHEFPIHFQIPEDVKFTRVSITIESDGSVSDVSLVIPSGDARLDRVALDCTYKWHFKPATDGNGVPIKSVKESNIVWSNN